jgi:hypothetical protein
MFKQILATALLASSFTVGATGIDVGLSDTSARFAYLTESGALGYAGADVGYSFFYNDQGDNMLGARLLVIGNAVGAQRAFQYGFGMQANLGKLNAEGGTHVAAIGVGGTLRYLFPSQNPIGLTVEAFTSPQITSFSGTGNIYNADIRLDLEVIPNTRGYIGYRVMEIEHNDLDTKESIEDAMVYGVRFSF